MLDAIERARGSITIEAYIYWAGISACSSLGDRREGPAGVRVKLLLDAIGSSTIGKDILEILEDGQCHLAWYNPSAGDDSAGSTIAPIVSL